MTNKLQQYLEEYVNAPLNPMTNYKLGLEYHKIGNSAAAISFLLRTAELTDDDDLAYDCLLINALNFRKQGKRNGSFKNQVLHAIGLKPNRPEGFFILSRFFEEEKQYHECYAFAKIGLDLPTADKTNEILEYYGKYVLEFELAVSAWWVWQREESRKRFRNLLDNYDMIDIYIQSCKNNLSNIGEPKK